ncbi:MAG: hypothetical protein HPY50_10435 [Firmicutes bacterium]|nr:hypothetical protein [Bacillota bacterium]
MSNNLLLWSFVVLPWFTLVLMKKRDIKRYMPAALFTIVTTSLVMESGITMKLWYIRETVYPLKETIPYVYGLAPVVAIWVLRYTYRSFWLYLAVDTAFNSIFAFFFTPWLVSRGIKDLYATSFSLFLIVTGLSLLLYTYQVWQDETLVTAEKGRFWTFFQPAANKPRFKDPEDKMGDL